MSGRIHKHVRTRHRDSQLYWFGHSLCGRRFYERRSLLSRLWHKVTCLECLRLRKNRGPTHDGPDPD